MQVRRYYCQPLTLYEEKEYRVWRSKWQKAYVERKISYQPDPQFCQDGKEGESFYWSMLTLLRGYEGEYRFANRSGKIKANNG